MTKELHFDLEFTVDGKVKSLSPKGTIFLDSLDDVSGIFSAKQIYTWATEGGLHIRFETAEIRDQFSNCARA